MYDLIFTILPIAIAIAWLIVTVLSIIFHIIWTKDNDELDLGKRGSGLYPALGLFPITSIFGFHIIPMCTSTGAKILHLVFRFLLMAAMGTMGIVAAVSKCPAGSICVVNSVGFLVIPILIILIVTYLFTVIESIIAFTKAQK